MSVTHAAATRMLWRKRARRWLKRLPRRANLGRYPVLRQFARWLRPYPWLWSYRSPYWTRAMYVGWVVTFLPLIGCQGLVGALLAVVFRANLPLVVLLQFVSNPLTGPFMYTASYQVGAWLLAPWNGARSWASAAAWNLAVGGLACGLVMAAGTHGAAMLYRRLYNPPVPGERENPQGASDA